MISKALREIIGKIKVSAVTGSVFERRNEYQDRRYQERVERLMAERAAKQKQEASHE